MSYIVSPEWVREQKVNETDTVIIDVRFSLADESYGRDAYESAHINGAFFLDIKKDLSSPLQKHGGNHPLPNIEELAIKLGNVGVDSDTTVIFYDDGNGMYASRAWWLLHFMGHEHVYILDGGFKAWQQLGYEVTDTLPKSIKKEFQPTIRESEIVDMETVKKRNRNKTILIDARSKERYLGEVEPLYHKAGHIPGAKNHFWQNNFDDDGTWKTSGALQEDFERLTKEDTKEIIVSCGSGISACPNIVALKMAGFENVKLYPGSFSDWISYDDNELETIDETN